MKKLLNFIVASSLLLSGCAGVREAGKGFVGVSTRVLEQNRPSALKQSFALDYNHSYLKAQEILKAQGAYIYAQDQKMIAVYVSTSNTTPVGVFFSEEAGKTLVEVSSPSIYAKETIAQKVFAGLKQLEKPDAQEKKADVKEKPAN